MKTYLFFLRDLLKDRKDIVACIPNIHDAFFLFVKDDKIDEAKQIIKTALQMLNDLLMKSYGFTHPLRLSFAQGKNFYQVKG